MPPTSLEMSESADYKERQGTSPYHVASGPEPVAFSPAHLANRTFSVASTMSPEEQTLVFDENATGT